MQREMVEKIKAGYQLKSVVLVNSVFKRKEYNFRPNQFRTGLDTKSIYPERSVVTALSVQIEEDGISHDDFFILVEMVGVFDYEQEPEKLPKETFANMNAPAIIFPYIRQHIRNLSLEAGFTPPIILPLVNFQKFFMDDHKESNGE